MKCRTCGNEVSSEEVFCGQCGTPITPPQSLQTEMMRTSTSRPDNANRYPTGQLQGQQGLQRQAQGQAQSMSGGTQMSRPQGVPFSSPPPSNQQNGANQNTEFYRDETEAISILPNNPQAGYQQPYPPVNAYPPQVSPTNYGYPQQPQQPQQSPQQTPYIQGPPMQTGNYAGQGYQQQPFASSQNYRNGIAPTQRQSGSLVTFLVSICLVIALLSVVGVGTLFYLKSRNVSPQPNPTQAVIPTTVPTATPDVPTPTPTLVPTDTPTPTPTVVPTATPVTGFAYCGTLCTDNGFSTQYPEGWSASEYSGGPGVVFANPDQTDQTATFKTPGTTSSSASDLVANDLQQNFATKDGYTVVTPIAADSLGGETWFKEVISYQEIGQQKENVEVYATVHENKAFILELQASDDQFATVASTDFQTIKSQFQFSS